jgi:hypothetical protein
MQGTLKFLTVVMKKKSPGLLFESRQPFVHLSNFSLVVC